MHNSHNFKLTKHFAKDLIHLNRPTYMYMPLLDEIISNLWLPLPPPPPPFLQ